MGWWKIKNVETGQIAWKPREKGVVPIENIDSLRVEDICDEIDVVNAIPGQDSEKEYYNGDGPADIVGDCIDKLIESYKETWKRPPYIEELEAAINFVMGPYRKGWYNEKLTVTEDFTQK